MSEEGRITRRLAAILAADVAGYSRLMQLDENTTLANWWVARGEIIDPAIVRRGGRIVKHTGDGFLAEFPTASDAVRCGLEMQERLSERFTNKSGDRAFAFRMGINLGEIVVDDEDIYGDGVNIAARLEALAEPGGLWISRAVHEQIRGKIEQAFDDQGHKALKNIAQPVHAYRARTGATVDNVTSQPLFNFDAAVAARASEFSGGCHCGNIRYESSQPPIGSGFCHCRICQRSAGAPVNAWTAFPEGSVRFTRGQPRWYASSKIAERGFCENCGTSLTYRLMKPNPATYFVVSTPTLDNPLLVAPTWHGGIESQLPWLQISDDLPRTRCAESPELRAAWASVGINDDDSWK